MKKCKPPDFHLSVTMAATLIFMVSRIGPKWYTSICNGAIGPIRDTIKSTMSAKAIDKKKRKKLIVNRISELDTVQWTLPPGKSLNRLFKALFSYECSYTCL